MLQSLSIRDVVLITRLDLSFGGGLCVLTGETGAGKSILLDSLGLALGMRAEARLVRSGAERAQVTATFDLPADRAFRERLTEQGIPLDDGVVMLKRLLGTDGRSRAFINDEPVSVGLLRDVGDALVEIHGQFESQRLTDPKNHRDLLDAFGGLGTARVRCAQAHAAWRAAHKAVRAAREALETARRDEDFMRHAVEELDALAPMAGEDAELSSRRGLLQASEKLIEAVSEATKAVSDGRGIENALTQALVHLERAAPR
ncbi:MAG: AAA family ATPase, partial [Rhodospirillales bacterium]